MKLAEWLLRALNRLVTFLTCLMLLLAGLYAVYALWDNRQVYESAGSVQESLLKLKPKPSEEGTESDPGFEELQALNPDVCAWLSLEGTEIEYPVLQGRTNLSYISTDVYGKYSLAGSIFLDSRNGRNGEDLYNLVYGHHMENHRMFGDLELYRDSAFFSRSGRGSLLLPERSYRLTPVLCFQCPASEMLIFDPEYAQMHLAEMLAFAERSAEQRNGEALAALRADEVGRVLALTTCSTDFTDSRTVVLMAMEEN